MSMEPEEARAFENWAEENEKNLMINFIKEDLTRLNTMMAYLNEHDRLSPPDLEYMDYDDHSVLKGYIEKTHNKAFGAFCLSKWLQISP